MTQNLHCIGIHGIAKVHSAPHQVLAHHQDLFEQELLVDRSHLKTVYPTTIITIVTVLVLAVLQAPQIPYRNLEVRLLILLLSPHPFSQFTHPAHPPPPHLLIREKVIDRDFPQHHRLEEKSMAMPALLITLPNLVKINSFKS